MSAVLAAARAELTKLITLRSAWLIMGVIGGLHLLVQVQAMDLYADAVSRITPDGTIEIFLGEPEPATTAILDALVASSLQVSVFLPSLAAVMAGQEFRGPQLGHSLLAVPRRGRLLAAKALAAAGYLLLPTLLIVGISTAFSYLAVRDWNPGLLLSADALHGQATFVAYAVLLSLTTFSITIVVRGALAAIIVSVALIALTMTRVLAGTPALDALLPVSAARNLLLKPETSDLTASPVQALVVLVGWVLVTTLAAGVALARRDAR